MDWRDSRRIYVFTDNKNIIDNVSDISKKFNIEINANEKFEEKKGD